MNKRLNVDKCPKEKRGVIIIRENVPSPVKLLIINSLMNPLFFLFCILDRIFFGFRI